MTSYELQQLALAVADAATTYAQAKNTRQLAHRNEMEKLQQYIDVRNKLRVALEEIESQLDEDQHEVSA
jgi:hypothetical protein